MFARLTKLLGMILLFCPVAPAYAQTVSSGVASAGELKVCIWPDYYGISYRSPRDGQLRGIDIDLSSELAADLAVRVAYVDTSFPRFMDDLAARRCDVAMFGVGVLPERAERVRFTAPYMRSDIFAIALRQHPTIRAWADIDRPGNIVAVQSGTFMEPVMRNYLRNAQILIVAPPATREREVQAGRADVFMTDYPYSRRLLDNADWARLIEPPTSVSPISYAYAVAPGDDAWLARIDTFVASIKRDGRLLRAATSHRLDSIVIRD